MNIFQQFYKSLYSPKDIAFFRFQGIGKTIFYVFFLTLLSIIPAVYYSASAIVNSINALEESIETDLPDFQIVEGELISDQNAPVIINKSGFAIIFDSTGAVQPEALSNNENTIALLKKNIYIIAAGQHQSYSYSMLNNIELTKEDLSGYLASAESLLAIIIPLIAIVIFIFTAGMRFVEISIFALVGLLIKNALRKNLQYRHLWRMSAYSITLPAVFFTIMAGLQTIVPNGAFINWFVSVIILFLALKEVPHPKKKEN